MMMMMMMMMYIRMRLHTAHTGTKNSEIPALL